MHLQKITILILASSTALACSNLSQHTPPSGHSLVVYHSSGGPAPIVQTFYAYSDGRVVLSLGDQTTYWKSNLAPFESRRLHEALANPAMEEIRAAAEASGYVSGCCDMEDFVVEYRGLVLAFPCGEPVTSGALRILGSLVNDIARDHFIAGNFIPTSCFEPESTPNPSGGADGYLAMRGPITHL
jgi:hypothetical protein